MHSLHLTDDIRERLSRLRRVQWLRLSTDTIPADFRWIGQLTQLRGLSLAGTALNGGDFSQLRNLQSLQLLDLFDADMSVKDFETLPQLIQLQALRLSGSRVVDGHLVHLAQLRLPSLRRLDLYDTHISDVGLGELCRSYNLTHLDLYLAENVTGNVVDDISRMTHLRKLAVGGTGLAPRYLWTPELDKLHNLLPRCSIDCGD